MYIRFSVYKFNQGVERINRFFGQFLPEAKNFAFVGGQIETMGVGMRNGLVFGEMWIPVVRK